MPLNEMRLPDKVMQRSAHEMRPIIVQPKTAKPNKKSASHSFINHPEDSFTGLNTLRKSKPDIMDGQTNHTREMK